MIVRAVFDDPVAAGIGVLSSGLHGRPETFAQSVTVTNQRAAGHVPHVHVALDGDAPQYPIVSRVVLRITAWHAQQEDAYDLAQLCQALMLSHSGSTIAACRPAAGPVPDVDPDSGRGFATFLVNATIRATIIN